MNNKCVSIRPFIGAKDYDLSRSFYRDLGFEEVVLSPDMSLFKTDQCGFYLQKAYVKDWIDNSMIFLEVEDVDLYWQELVVLDLTTKYPGVRLTPVGQYDWGRECFMHDPCGILWHFGEFKKG
jgi:catechol 2,3-dioxygenase-like lactoylglutathione lyase family enzyme